MFLGTTVASASSCGLGMTWTLTNSPTRRTRIGRRLHRANVAAAGYCYKAGADVLLAFEHDLRRLDHRVGRFHRSDETLRFNHS